ncbi:MAG: S-formylglutathione hydrolase [Maricaulaceae bacterium]|nr:S-formylglutathione hydrolase [Maricaulaceae bacterium]
MKTVSENKCFGGRQLVIDHDSAATGTAMRFGVFLPPHASNTPCPVVFFLSGLTCTHENFTLKAGAQRLAAELGLIIVAPDTSPRGEEVADIAGDYSLGQGAGFYVDATEAPWARHYRMFSYITDELFDLVTAAFPADPARAGITGHSMGGHGALVCHLRRPDRFRAVSAFAPVAAPSQVPWGRAAFTAYLGADEQAWAAYDATQLVAGRPDGPEILIDQGEADTFLAEQLRPDLFEAAAKAAGRRVRLRRHPGYDHSYFFIASFIDGHLRHHAKGLG